MATSITIDNLDDNTLRQLQAEASRRGLKVQDVVAEILRQRLPGDNMEQAQTYDLDHLAGTWTDEDAKSFLAQIADFDRVDESLWK